MSTFYAAETSPSTHALRAVEIAAAGAVQVHQNPVFVSATQPSSKRQVALVSGGGAGHEPMHANFVGAGGLDAAVPGEVFTSPHSGQIYVACKASAKASGVLQIVKNYTGDKINFAIAAQRLQTEGIAVKELLIDDDLGSDLAQINGPGRRGTATTVIVEKILGAAADTGLDLQQLHAMGQKIVKQSRSLAVARAAHTAPGAAQRAFEVAENILEYGVGIHGETAREQIPQPTLSELIQRIVAELAQSLSLAAKTKVIALVNNLGGIAPLELAHISVEVEKALHHHQLEICSLETGSYITALDMAGFSITLSVVDEELLTYWFAPHATAGLPSPKPYAPYSAFIHQPLVTTQSLEPDTANSETEFGEVSAWLNEFIAALTAVEAPLNKLDQKAGDGDVGTNLAGAARAAKSYAKGKDADFATDLDSIAEAFLNDTGGSSGPLFGLVLSNIASAAHDGESLLNGVREGAAAVTKVGGAEPGDRTIIDALNAAVQSGESQLTETAVVAAIHGAEATAQMVGKKGRSSYLGQRVLGTIDPGALAMAYVLLMIYEGASGQRLSVQQEKINELLNS